MVLLVVLFRALRKPWRIVALILLMAVVALPEFCSGEGKTRTAEHYRAGDAGKACKEATSKGHHKLLSGESFSGARHGLLTGGILPMGKLTCKMRDCISAEPRNSDRAVHNYKAHGTAGQAGAGRVGGREPLGGWKPRRGMGFRRPRAPLRPSREHVSRSPPVILPDFSFARVTPPSLAITNMCRCGPRCPSHGIYFRLSDLVPHCAGCCRLAGQRS